MNQNAHTIVIGSGFGGAVVAARLAEAGHKVSLFERGPWRDSVPVRSMGITARAPFPQGAGAIKRLFYKIGNSMLPGGRVTLNKKGLFELHLGRGLHVVCSAGVGGGSHVYAGLNVRPPDPDYWDNISSGLSTQQLEISYQRVLERMGSRAAMADDQLPHSLAARFADSDALDTHDADYELAMGLAFPQTPGRPQKVTTADGVERWEARHGQDGVLGSAGGGKTSVDFAFLARAIKQGLGVLDQCEVHELRRSGQGYQVHYTNHHTGSEEQLYANRVVVAAGTLNTLRLLLHSEQSGGLASMPGLGQRFGGNGDFFGYWKLDEPDRDLTATTPAHGLLKMRDREPLGSDQAWPMLAEGALFPPGQLPLGRWAGRMLRSGTFVAGMGADAQNGRVSYRKGRLKIDYRPADSEIFSRIRKAFELIGEKTARRIFHFDTPITVHPTGGACIGRDPADGVVSDSGEVFSNPGLFVADAAALPKPVAGPPSMTIAAWADHVADGLINNSADEA